MSQNQSNHSRNSSKNNITSSENNYNKKYATDTTQNSDKKMQHKISINQKLESSLKRMEISTKNLLRKGRDIMDEPRGGVVSNFQTGSDLS